MSLMDSAGNIITLGVAYKLTDDLLSKTTRKRRKKKRSKKNCR